MSAGAHYNKWLPVYNALDYLQCDGQTDDSNEFNALVLNALGANNHGAVIVFPPGDTVLQGGLIQNNLVLQGAGSALTRLILPAGANQPLLWGGAVNAGLINTQNQSIGTGNPLGLNKWQIRGMTLDGAKGAQTGGTSYCLQAYGFGFQLDDVVCQNGYTGGVQLDWNGGSSSPAGSDSMVARVNNLNIHSCNGIGLDWGGPHDSVFVNCIGWLSGYEDVYCGPHSGFTHFTNCHYWSPGQQGSAPTFLVENGVFLVNCQVEGSATAQVVILANSGGCILGGAYYSNNINGVGIQYGQQAGDVPFYNSSYQSGGVATAIGAKNWLIETLLHDNNNAKGYLYFRNDGGYNLTRVTMYNLTAPGTGVAYTGGPSPNSILEYVTTGLTAGQLNSNFQHLSGDVSFQQPTSAQNLVNGNTINVGNNGSVVVTNGGAVTAIALQIGVIGGQKVTVQNKGTGSITFDVVGNSHVVGGAAISISSAGQMIFEWNGVDSVWYHTP